MELLTKTHRELLLANGRCSDQDHAPVVKFFKPGGAATWLLSELDPADGDTLFGLGDHGFGFPELGYFSLTEISATRLEFGLRIERDLHFQPRYPLSVYAAAARTAGRIVEHGPEIEAVVSDCAEGVMPYPGCTPRLADHSPPVRFDSMRTK